MSWPGEIPVKPKNPPLGLSEKQLQALPSLFPGQALPLESSGSYHFVPPVCRLWSHWEEDRKEVGGGVALGTSKQDRRKRVFEKRGLERNLLGKCQGQKQEAYLRFSF